MIVGAGLVGMAAAVSLAQNVDGQSYRVVLVDQKTPNTALANAREWDSRIYAITPSSIAWLKALGVWQLMDATRMTAIKAMHIVGDDQSDTSQLQLSASDASLQSLCLQNLGFIVENQQLMHALWQKLQTLNVEIITGVACENLTTTSQTATLSLANQQIIKANLIVAADGVNSWVRAQAKIAVTSKSYQQTAIVANFSCEKPHLGVAFQWFGAEALDADSILAFLPMPKSQISIVWSVATTKAQQLLNLSDDEFIAQLSLLSNNSLGALNLVTARLSFPLQQQRCERLIAERVILIGDAAHQVHPLAGQGVNLGFRDVMALERILIKSLTKNNANTDIASHRSLREYERARAVDIMSMMQLTDGLNQLFSAKNGLIKSLRNWGLSKINQQSLIKKILIQQAIH